MKIKSIKRLIATVVAFTTVFSSNVMYAGAATTTSGITVTDSSTEDDSNVLKVNIANDGSVTYQEPANATYETPNEDTPFTWDNALVYFVLTDRFENGDTSNDHSYGRSLDEKGNVISGYKDNMGTFHGGDLKGLTKKLDDGYFTKLGVNAIWITAPYEQMHGYTYANANNDQPGYGFPYYGYHGYWALDFTNVDANMGTKQDMHNFVDTAHELGIRVVMDVVMNHTGYISAYDAVEYGYGKPIANWKDTYYRKDLQNQMGGDWEEENLWVANDPSWANWWGPDFVRTSHAFPGYDGSKSGGDLVACLYGLPDIKMESTKEVSTPPLMVNKWKKEGRYDEEIAKQNKFFTESKLPRTPQNYVVQWLSDWVREYGIDGFRCDTAKHVPKSSWGELKRQSDIALKEWRANNKDKAASNWTDDFWMTGEEWGYGVGKSDYYTTGGFDSMINFSFRKSSYSNSELEGTFSNYANTINSDNSFNALTYISSHDTSLGGRANLITAGNALLLIPGGAQIYYGDESGRSTNPAWQSIIANGYTDQGTRSDMNWSNMDNAVLSHWQKLGQFRYNHSAIGAGQHQQLSASPYTFSRIYENADKGINDRVVVSIPGTAGQTTVSVEGVFSDGAKVRDAYTDTMYTVQNGKVSVTAGTNGVILLEKGDKSPDVGVSPTSRTYYTDTLDLKLSVTNDASATYSIDGLKEVSYTNGTKLTIGSGLDYGTTTTITVKAQNADGTAGPSTYTFTKGDPSDRKVKVRVKMDKWTTAPNIYVYSGDGTSAVQYTGKWPGKAMTSEGDGWYSYETYETGSAKVIFNGSFGQLPSGVGSSGFDVEGSMQYLNGVWSTIEDTTLKVNALTPSSSTTTVGTPVTFTASAVGSGDLSYQYEVNSSVVQAYSSSKTYSFNPSAAGTYKVKVTAKDSTGKTVSKEISYVVESGNQNNLAINSLGTSIQSPQKVGTSIKLTANATGSGTVQYKFTAVNASGNETILKSYNTTNNVTWTPSVAGTYKLYVYAKDSSGVEKSKFVTYTINNNQTTTLAINSFSTDKASGQNVGTAIKISANATGSGTVKYRFVAQSGNYKEVIQDFNTNGIVTWAPKKTGTYVLFLRATDSTGKVVEKQITDYVIKNSNNLAVNSFAVDKVSPQAEGTTIKMSANATGSGTVKYRFVAQSGNYKEVIQDFNTNGTVTWTPKKAGTYVLFLRATDSTGKVVEKQITDYVIKNSNNLAVNSFAVDKVSPQAEGTTIKMSANATGSGTVKYRFVAQSGNYKEVIQDFNTNGTVTWTPKKAGTYVLFIRATDSTGKVVEKQIKDYVVSSVTKLNISSIIANKVEPQKAGTAITLSTAATGTGTLLYKYWAYNTNGSWTSLKDFSTGSSVVWTPKTSGNYVIWVDVKDSDGNVTHKFIDYKITEGAKRVEQDNSKITYTSNWATASNAEYSGNTLKYTVTSGAKATFKFTGTGINIISATGSNRGVAMVTIDGVTYSADMYTKDYVFGGKPLEINGLTNGTHTITISYTGMNSGSSTGTMITLDAFDIIGGDIV